MKMMNELSPFIIIENDNPDSQNKASEKMNLVSRRRENEDGERESLQL